MSSDIQVTASFLATLLLVSILPLNGMGIYSSVVSSQFRVDNWRLREANVLKPPRKLLPSTQEAE